MSVNFKDGNRKQQFQSPPSVEDWLPEDHLPKFVVEIVEQLDISPIKNEYSGRSSAACDPEIMIALSFYGYLQPAFRNQKE